MALGSKVGFFGFKYSVATASSSETVTISDAGYATHASSFAVDYSNRADGLKAYTVSYDQGSNTLSYSPVNGVVAAGKAVVLEGDAKEYTLKASSETATVKETGLETSNGKVTGGEGIYCLANKTNGVGFYIVNSTVTIPANKAYLKLPAVSSARTAFYSIGGGNGTTGIGAIQAETVQRDGAIYTLSGQRVSSAYKGIVIKNGKKMILK